MDRYRLRGIPYKKGFLWWVPYIRIDGEGWKHREFLRFDIGRGCFIDRQGDAAFRKRALKRLKKEMERSQR